MLAEADLPDNPEVLRDMIVAANAKTALLTAEVERISADAELRAIAQVEADGEIARLNSINAVSIRHRLAPRSEKLDGDQFELVVEDLGIAVAKVEAKLDADLERIKQLIDADRKQCACCGGHLHAIGDNVAERLDKVLASFRVMVARRPRNACRSCKGDVVQAPAPTRIVDGGLPTDALVAQVLVSRYADYLPLYRRAQIYVRQGVTLDRSTLADWTGRAAWWLTRCATICSPRWSGDRGCSPKRRPRRS
ncbi:transposase (plasmid) [Polymorphobacter sp. PAMC 29334]|uniref:IS66 family transposase n=1 Tax=Polymorphobacter sp. PAMC 29334 TaxID=2862331 RepID=UPI001C796FE8|nr:transposase [Polymorphobacter sp. PAMC 29334]QYE33197.1 transposase [Polymorphobacter sp. PAMC 29334]